MPNKSSSDDNIDLDKDSKVLKQKSTKSEADKAIVPKEKAGINQTQLTNLFSHFANNSLGTVAYSHESNDEKIYFRNEKGEQKEFSLKNLIISSVKKDYDDLVKAAELAGLNFQECLDSPAASSKAVVHSKYKKKDEPHFDNDGSEFSTEEFKDVFIYDDAITRLLGARLADEGYHEIDDFPLKEGTSKRSIYRKCQENYNFVLALSPSIAALYHRYLGEDDHNYAVFQQNIKTQKQGFESIFDGLRCLRDRNRKAFPIKILAPYHEFSHYQAFELYIDFKDGEYNFYSTLFNPFGQDECFLKTSFLIKEIIIPEFIKYFDTKKIVYKERERPYVVNYKQQNWIQSGSSTCGHFTARILANLAIGEGPRCGKYMPERDGRRDIWLKHHDIDYMNSQKNQGKITQDYLNSFKAALREQNSTRRKKPQDLNEQKKENLIFRFLDLDFTMAIAHYNNYQDSTSSAAVIVEAVGEISKARIWPEVLLGEEGLIEVILKLYENKNPTIFYAGIDRTCIGDNEERKDFLITFVCDFLIALKTGEFIKSDNDEPSVFDAFDSKPKISEELFNAALKYSYNGNSLLDILWRDYSNFNEFLSPRKKAAITASEKLNSLFSSQGADLGRVHSGSAASAASLAAQTDQLRLDSGQSRRRTPKSEQSKTIVSKPEAQSIGGVYAGDLTMEHFDSEQSRRLPKSERSKRRVSKPEAQSIEGVYAGDLTMEHFDSEQSRRLPKSERSKTIVSKPEAQSIERVYAGDLTMNHLENFFDSVLAQSIETDSDVIVFEGEGGVREINFVENGVQKVIICDNSEFKYRHTLFANLTTVASKLGHELQFFLNDAREEERSSNSGSRKNSLVKGLSRSENLISKTTPEKAENDFFKDFADFFKMTCVKKHELLKKHVVVMATNEENCIEINYVNRDGNYVILKYDALKENPRERFICNETDASGGVFEESSFEIYLNDVAKKVYPSCESYKDVLRPDNQNLNITASRRLPAAPFNGPNRPVRPNDNSPSSSAIRSGRRLPAAPLGKKVDNSKGG